MSKHTFKITVALVRSIVLAARGIIPLDTKPRARSASYVANIADSAEGAIIRDTLSNVVARGHCFVQLYTRVGESVMNTLCEDASV